MKRLTKTELFNKVLITICQHYNLPAEHIKDIEHVLAHFDVKTTIGTLATNKTGLAILLAGAGLPLCYEWPWTPTDDRGDGKDIFYARIQASAITTSDTLEIFSGWGSIKPTLENLRTQHHGPWALRVEYTKGNLKRLIPTLLINTSLPEPERTNQGITKSSEKEYNDECRTRNEQYWNNQQ